MALEISLAGKGALVTGGSRGLGRALCLAFAEAGASVDLTYRSRREDAEETARAVEAYGARSAIHRLDLADDASIDGLGDAMEKAETSPDLLVLNAAVTADRLLARTDEALWDQMLRVDLTGTVRLCRRLLPLLAPGGCVLLVASRAGIRGHAGLGAYGAAKAGLIGFGLSLAREVAADGVRVNVLVPGYLPTDMGRAAPEAMAAARAESLLGRLSDVNETARFAVHLCSLQHVTGQVVRVDSRL